MMKLCKITMNNIYFLLIYCEATNPSQFSADATVYLVLNVNVKVFGSWL